MTPWVVNHKLSACNKIPDIVLLNGLQYLLMLQYCFRAPKVSRCRPRHQAFSGGHINQRRLTRSVIQMSPGEHPAGNIGLVAIEGQHVPHQLVLLNKIPIARRFEIIEGLHDQIPRHFYIIILGPVKPMTRAITLRIMDSPIGRPNRIVVDKNGLRFIHHIHG